MITDWDAAYSNRDAVPEFGAILERWRRDAAAFRVERPPRILRHGPHDRETTQLFIPEGAPKGLIVFIHGGYWRSLEPDDFSHLAAGGLAHGWAVAAPGYPLCPEVAIADITRSAARAIEAAAREVGGPVILSGHSAGGHLAARMSCADTPLSEATAARVARIIAISGVFDLRPLIRTAMNGDLRLSLASARAESPILMEPREGARLVAWVGRGELAAFRRQSASFAGIWSGLGADAASVEAAEANHFTVIDPLADPASPLIAALVGGDPGA